MNNALCFLRQGVLDTYGVGLRVLEEQGKVDMTKVYADVELLSVQAARNLQDSFSKSGYSVSNSGMLAMLTALLMAAAVLSVLDKPTPGANEPS